MQIHQLSFQRLSTDRHARAIVGTVCILALLESSVLTCLADDKDPLPEILQRLEQSEQRYANIDVAWICQHQLSDPANVPAELTRSLVEQGTFVRQDGMFRIEFQIEILRGNDDPAMFRKKILWDGKFTRSFVHQASQMGTSDTWSRTYEFPDDPHYFLPHTIALEGKRRLKVPLATWFRGFDSAAISYGGHQQFDGMECEVVSVSLSKGVRRDFWLAVDFNDLPVMAQEFRLRESSEHPAAEWILSDLREISPGIWFPFHSRLEVYDYEALLEDGSQISRLTEECIVERVSLNPDYDISYFRDLKLPD